MHMFRETRRAAILNLPIGQVNEESIVSIEFIVY